ncbi:MAG TPA: hypothetical protein VEF36_13845, partial [Roseiarcus sp.]|nr:hypothetical protein [Roseiarcus sp.]
RSVSQFAKLVADAPPRLERLSRLIEREEAEGAPAQAPGAPAGGRWPWAVEASLWVIAAALVWIALRLR